MALESEQLNLGAELIPFSLPDVSGNTVSLESHRKHPLLLIIFMCNHCPYAKAAWPLLIALQQRYAEDGYRTIAINSNDNPNYPEDAFETMKPYAEQTGISFPYLFDAGQGVAKAYKAACTPDPYLFSNGKLFYHGRINDNWQHPENVTEKSLELHILAALGRETPPKRQVPSMGCSIKWVTT